jgi:sec-independent protein translocase protein TatC
MDEQPVETRRRRRGFPEDPDDYRLTLVEHLEELRGRIIRLLSYITVGWVIGWFLQPYLYDILNTIVRTSVVEAVGRPDLFSEAFRDATQPFMLKLRLSFFIGLVLVMPLCINEIWGFIAPGLTPTERKPIQRLAPASLALFLMGAGFCWLILPATIQWFAGFITDFSEVQLIQEPGTMVFFALKMLLAFGIAFQLPLVVVGLGAIGLLTAETLTKYWRHAASIIFIFSALITPSSDPISMLTMAVPLVILFAISVWVVKVTQRKRERALEAEPLEQS